MPNLTPEERAEYLANLSNLSEGQYYVDRVRIIAAEIRAAAEEAIEITVHGINDEWDAAYRRGAEEEREECAKVARDHRAECRSLTHTGCGEAIEHAIRSRGEK